MLEDQVLRRRLIRFGLFLVVALWFMLIISPCINFLNSFYPFQKQLLSTVCHQNTYKTFFCNYTPLLVCARCTGIYAGALFVSFAVILYSKQFIFKTNYLALLSAPMLIDVILLNFGFYNYYKPLSAFTGFLFGSSVFLYILSAIENLLFSKQKLKNEQQ